MKNFLVIAIALVVGLVTFNSNDLQARVADGWSSSQWPLAQLLNNTDEAQGTVVRRVYKRKFDIAVGGTLSSGATRSLEGTIPDEATVVDCYLKIIDVVTNSAGASGEMDLGCDASDDLFNGADLDSDAANSFTAGTPVASTGVSTAVHVAAECTPTLTAKLGDISAGSFIVYCAYDYSE